MAAKPTEKERSAELAVLRDRSLEILDAVRPHFPPELWALHESAVKRTYDARDLKGLRLMSKDLHEMAGGLSLDEQASLDESLRSKFGTGLREESSKERRDVKANLETSRHRH